MSTFEFLLTLIEHINEEIESTIAYIYEAIDDLEEMVNQVIFSPGGSYLGVDDQIALLRLAASRYCIYNELEKLEKAYNKAVELIKDTTLKTSHTHLLVIHATKLHQEGEYRRAFE